VGDCVEYMVYVLNHTSFSANVEKARVVAILSDSKYEIIINEDLPQKTRTELANGKDLFHCPNDMS